jgi:hypothetical protein
MMKTNFDLRTPGIYIIVNKEYFDCLFTESFEQWQNECTRTSSGIRT